MYYSRIIYFLCLKDNNGVPNRLWDNQFWGKFGHFNQNHENKEIYNAREKILRNFYARSILDTLFILHDKSF